MAKKLEATEEEILHAMHPHPTYSEAVMEAAGQGWASRCTSRTDRIRDQSPRSAYLTESPRTCRQQCEFTAHCAVLAIR